MLYHIENEALFAAIDSKGAQLHSLKSRSTKTEYLWQGNPAVWYGQAPVLFPFVGQLKNGSFFYDGREYFMKKHGFARISEFRPLQVQGGCAEFLLESSSETLRCYPFAFSLLLRYELCGSTLTATAQLKNTDEKEMLFSIGAHPGFNCEMGDVLRFDQPETLASEWINEESLLAGGSYSLLNDETDLLLTPHLFDKDALILQHVRSKCVTLVRGGVPALKFRIGGAPVLGIWAKPGAPYVCLEPWFGINDADVLTPDLRQKRLIQALAPGAVFEQVWAVKTL